MYIIPANGTIVNPHPHRKRKKGLAASVSTKWKIIFLSSSCIHNTCIGPLRQVPVKEIEHPNVTIQYRTV